jgi:hypothetical protein
MDKEIIYPDLVEEKRKAAKVKNAAKGKPAKERMTKSEKINITISLFALLLAVVSPIFTYYWLDPALQSFKHRGRFEISEQTNVHFDLTKEDITKNTNPIFTLTILNVGQLPAKDAVITIQYIDEKETSNDIELDPPMPIDVVIKGKNKFITLKRPIGSNDSVSFVTPAKFIEKILVSNEFGETDTINPRMAADIMGKVIKESELKQLLSNPPAKK